MGSGNGKEAAPSGLTRPVVVLSLSRLTEAAGNGFVLLAIPASVAILPADLLPFDETVRVGLTISMFGLVMAVTQPIMGRLASRRNADRRLVLAGLAAFSVSTAAMALATTFWQLLLLRTVQGVCMAMIIPPTLALIAGHSPLTHRGAAMGFYGMARMLGFGLGPVLGGWLLIELTTQSAYLTAAAPAIAAAVLIIVGVPAVRQSEDALPPLVGGQSGAFTAAPTHSDGLKPFLALALGLFAAACSVSIIIVLENDFIRRLGINTFEFGLAFSAMIFVRIFTDWPIGRLSDRIGRKTLIVPGLLALGPLTVLMSYMPTTGSLTAVRVLMGIAMAFVSAPTFALAADLSPPGAIAAKVSWVTAGFSLGLAFGPLLTGVLAALYGFHAPFWLFGGLCIAAAAVASRSITPLSRSRSLDTLRLTERANSGEASLKKPFASP